MGLFVLRALEQNWKIRRPFIELNDITPGAGVTTKWILCLVWSLIKELQWTAIKIVELYFPLFTKTI